MSRRPANDDDDEKHSAPPGGGGGATWTWEWSSAPQSRGGPNQLTRNTRNTNSNHNNNNNAQNRNSSSSRDNGGSMWGLAIGLLGAAAAVGLGYLIGTETSKLEAEEAAANQQQHRQQQRRQRETNQQSQATFPQSAVVPRQTAHQSQATHSNSGNSRGSNSSAQSSAASHPATHSSSATVCAPSAPVRPAPTTARESDLIDELDDALLCKICLSEQSNALLTPCMHNCCCTTCAARLENCPVCRATIDQVVKVFKS